MPSRTVVTNVLDRIGPRVGNSRTWQPSSGGPLAVYGPNERTGTAGDAKPFLDVEFPVSISEQITIGAPGANVYRESGVFRLIIAARRGSGADQGLGWADELATLFRAAVFGGVRTYAPNPPTIDMNNDNGAFYLLGVAVPYDFDIQA